jgi:cell division protein ZapA
MSQVTVTINGRKYDISCDNGEEAHLTQLAEYVDRRVGELVTKVGQVGDARLLVMTSLLCADELSEVYTELDTVRDKKLTVTQNTFEVNDLDLMTARTESIAEKLEAV